jgi:hypothetical protein
MPLGSGKKDNESNSSIQPLDNDDLGDQKSS